MWRDDKASKFELLRPLERLEKYRIKRKNGKVAFKKASFKTKCFYSSSKATPLMIISINVFCGIVRVQNINGNVSFWYLSFLQMQCEYISLESLEKWIYFCYLFCHATMVSSQEATASKHLLWCTNSKPLIVKGKTNILYWKCSNVSSLNSLILYILVFGEYHAWILHFF